jgi:DNA-binding HxlR family transcriptional regulator
MVEKLPETTCPIERALITLGRRGTFLIVRDLLEGQKRFSELQRSTSLPPRTLSMRLKELEQAGLVTRTQYPEVPPRVEYNLTEHGKSLQTVLDALSAWGEKA